jgi:hypothetical protein
MIAPPVIQEVRRLLTEDKHSQREIARMTGVSRGTVTAVANGRRRDYVPPTREDDFPPMLGPRRRCPTCGAVVYTPCRLCLLRERISRDAKYRRRPDRRPDVPLELDLREQHRQRYEAVHLARMRAGELHDDEGVRI